MIKKFLAATLSTLLIFAMYNFFGNSPIVESKAPNPVNENELKSRPNTNTGNFTNSPFVTGVYNENKNKQIKIIGAPNLNWREKEILLNDKIIKYVFGQGNPIEVSLDPKEYKAPSKLKDGLPYVTPKSEYALREFLSDPMLYNFINRCSQYIYQEDTLYVDNSMEINNLSMENMLYIDQETHRKEINKRILENFNLIKNIVLNPLTDGDMYDGFGKKCLSRDDFAGFKILSEKFSEIGREYMNASGFSGEDE